MCRQMPQVFGRVWDPPLRHCCTLVCRDRPPDGPKSTSKVGTLAGRPVCGPYTVDCGCGAYGPMRALGPTRVNRGCGVSLPQSRLTPCQPPRQRGPRVDEYIDPYTVARGCVQTTAHRMPCGRVRRNRIVRTAISRNGAQSGSTNRGADLVSFARADEYAAIPPQALP